MMYLGIFFIFLYLGLVEILGILSLWFSLNLKKYWPLFLFFPHYFFKFFFQILPSSNPCNLGAPFTYVQVVDQMIKNLPAMRETQVQSLDGEDHLPGEGNGYPPQYSCLEDSIDRGAWRATSMGLQSQTLQVFKYVHGCTLFLTAC